jgi:hypothetical protein
VKALKTLVIVLGVLILAGIAVVGVTLYNRANRPGGLAGERPAAPATRPAERPSAASLGLPAGSRIRGIAGAGNRVVVHVELPGGQEQLLLLDPATGQVSGRLGVSEAPAGAPAQ